MGMAEFIAKRFVGQEMCLFVGEVGETLTYDQAWTANKEILRGTILEVEEGVVVINIPENGIIFVSGSEIKMIWHPSLDYHKAVVMSLTRRLVGARRKDG